MSRGQPSRSRRAEIRAYAQRNSVLSGEERIASFYADDCVYENLPQGGIGHGKDELNSVAGAMFAGIPDFNVVLTSVIVAGTQSCREWIITGSHTESGKRFEIRGASVAEFRGDKITRNTDYWDLRSMMKQLS